MSLIVHVKDVCNFFLISQLLYSTTEATLLILGEYFFCKVTCSLPPVSYCLKAGFTACVLLPPANEVCEGYVFIGVCLSTVGWGVRGGVCVWQGGVRGCGGGGACMRGDTVNERPVRILLECILVC